MHDQRRHCRAVYAVRNWREGFQPKLIIDYDMVIEQDVRGHGHAIK
jgi:hypothetical protein